MIGYVATLLTPSPGPPPLVRARVAAHPLPQGGEGVGLQSTSARNRLAGEHTPQKHAACPHRERRSRRSHLAEGTVIWTRLRSCSPWRASHGSTRPPTYQSSPAGAVSGYSDAAPPGLTKSFVLGTFPRLARRGLNDHATPWLKARARVSGEGSCRSGRHNGMKPTPGDVKLRLSPRQSRGYPGGFAPNRGVALAMRQPGLLRIEPRLKRFSFPHRRNSRLIVTANQSCNNNSHFTCLIR